MKSDDPIGITLGDALKKYGHLLPPPAPRKPDVIHPGPYKTISDEEWFHMQTPARQAEILKLMYPPHGDPTIRPLPQYRKAPPPEIRGQGEGRHQQLLTRCGQIWDGDYDSTLEKLIEFDQEYHDPPHGEKHCADVVGWFAKNNKAPNEKGPDVVLGSKEKFKSPLGSWLVDGDEFLARTIQPRKALVTDSATRAVLFYANSINQVFAFRGAGKSIVMNCLLHLLINGGEWLRFKSEGGLRVLLMDGELPEAQLHERLHEFSGASQGGLKILAPDLMPNPKEFPALSVFEDQRRFLKEIETFKPDVIIFDTLKRCFRFDTNDPDAWLLVNDFLVELRSLGICTVIAHHEGKNGTARGLTDGDDNLDVSIQLTKPYGHVPGEDLAFKWNYSKVRHGGHLPEFEARYTLETGWVITDDPRPGGGGQDAPGQ